PNALSSRQAINFEEDYPMKRHLRYVHAILAALALLSFSLIISAQEITGVINGSVKDANGAGISGATVTITDADKQVVVRTVTTNEGGEFNAPTLLVGFYDISVEAPNFKKSLLSRVKLDVASAAPSIWCSRQGTSLNLCWSRRRRWRL